MLGTFMPEFIYPSLDVKQSKNRRDTLRWDRGLDCAAIASHRLAGRDLLTYLLLTNATCWYLDLLWASRIVVTILEY